jgi:hypothetical protein
MNCIIPSRNSRRDPALTKNQQYNLLTHMGQKVVLLVEAHSSDSVPAGTPGLLVWFAPVGCYIMI